MNYMKKMVELMCQCVLYDFYAILEIYGTKVDVNNDKMILDCYIDEKLINDRIYKSIYGVNLEIIKDIFRKYSVL